jgi:hypothetical protein
LKKKRLQVLIVVSLMVMSAVFAIALLTVEEDDNEEDHIVNVEASGHGITVGDVTHSPKEPISGEDVYYYVKVEGLPSGYTVLLVAEYYNLTDTLKGRYTATMTRVSGIKYKDTDILNDDISGYTIKYKIMIYDQDWREVDDLYEDYEPILESDLHTFVVK